MLSDRVKRIDASGIRKVFDLAATMHDPINLSIGQPDYDVPDAVKEAGIAAIRAGFNRYTVTQGIPELHERVRAMLRETRGFEPEGLLITSGTSGGIVLALLATQIPGVGAVDEKHVDASLRVAGDVPGAVVLEAPQAVGHADGGLVDDGRLRDGRAGQRDQHRQHKGRAMREHLSPPNRRGTGQGGPEAPNRPHAARASSS